MKKLLFVIVAVVIITNLAFAGDENTPKTKVDDKAWLFSLGGLSNLSAGNFMGGVGGKYYISDKNAIRLSLGFVSTNTTIKYTGAAGTGSDEKISGTGFSLAPAYLHVLSADGPVAPYIGVQFSLALGSTTDENPGFVSNNKIKNSSTTFGVAGVAGVEWFPWQNISFGAEYQLGYATTSGTRDVTVGGTTTSTDLPSTNVFAAGSASSANLTVAVYW